MHSLPLDETTVIAAFREGGAARDDMWRFLFRNCKPGFVGIVRKNGGSEDEAISALADIAHLFERRVLAMHLPPVENLGAYLSQMVLYAFLRSKRNKRPVMIELDTYYKDFPFLSDDDQIESGYWEELDERIARLGEKCRKLIGMDLEGYPTIEIADAFGWENEDRVRKERYKCLQALKKGTP